MSMCHLYLFLQHLSVKALVCLLQSDALQLRCEEDTYFLVTTWIEQSPHPEASNPLDAFKRLIPYIRFEHFTPEYLINVVYRCPIMLASNLRDEVMSRALLCRRYTPSVRVKHKDFLHVLHRICLWTSTYFMDGKGGCSCLGIKPSALN